MTTQLALWCRHCGASELHARGLCQPCYDAWRLSERNFAGLREIALERDAATCTICLEHDQPVMHHRFYSSRLDHLITLCAACHARVHRTLYPDWTMHPQLRVYWRELHPGRPEQLPLLEGTTELHLLRRRRRRKAMRE